MSSALAEDAIPHLSGPVIDEVGIFNSSDRSRIESQLLELHRAGHLQMVVWVPQSLQGKDIATLSMEAAEAWKLGKKGQDRGLILVIAPNEKRMRLEVGYGLEGDITDAFSKRVLDQTLRPYFREQRYGDGVLAAINEIIKKLALLVTPADTGSELSGSSNRPLNKHLSSFLFFLLVIGLYFASVLPGSRGRRGVGGWGGGSSGWGGGGGFGGSSGGGGGFSGGGGGFGGGGSSSSW